MIAQHNIDFRFWPISTIRMHMYINHWECWIIINNNRWIRQTLKFQCFIDLINELSEYPNIWRNMVFYPEWESWKSNIEILKMVGVIISLLLFYSLIQSSVMSYNLPCWYYIIFNVEYFETILTLWITHSFCIWILARLNLIFIFRYIFISIVYFLYLFFAVIRSALRSSNFILNDIFITLDWRKINIILPTAF